MISANPAFTSQTTAQTTAQTTTQTTPQTTPDNLLKHPQLWRAGQLGRQQVPAAVASGYDALDAQLPGGGWPRAGLAEVLHEQPGLGELRLLAPALADLSQDENRWIAWINPPAIPYAPALGRFGIRSDRLLMIHPKSHTDALWAAEQAARSGTCSAVLIWLDESKLKHAETRRLQVAAKQGNVLACLFRNSSAAQHASAAELRLTLHATHTPATSTPSTPSNNNYSNMQVDVLKRRGGWAVDNIDVELVGDDPIKRLLDIQQQLSLWQDMRRQPKQATTLSATTSAASLRATPLAVNSNLNHLAPDPLQNQQSQQLH